VLCCSQDFALVPRNVILKNSAASLDDQGAVAATKSGASLVRAGLSAGCDFYTAATTLNKGLVPRVGEYNDFCRKH